MNKHGFRHWFANYCETNSEEHGVIIRRKISGNNATTVEDCVAFVRAELDSETSRKGLLEKYQDCGCELQCHVCKSYLLQIMTNAINQFFRKELRHPPGVRLDDFEESAEVPAYEMTPFREAAEEDSLRNLLETFGAALLSLSERQQSVLHLRAIQGLSTGETAKRLRLSEHSVRNTLSRARKRLLHLRKDWSDEGGEQ